MSTHSTAQRWVPWAAVTAAALGLAACGGGGGSSSSTDDGGDSTQASLVSLSGTVQTGSDSDSTSSHLASVARSQHIECGNTNGSSYSDVLVVAIDRKGNTKSTTADSGGDFDMELTSDREYALVFIDPRDLEVAGSLVRASDNGKGAVSVQDNTDLKKVVVDPDNGTAASEAEVCGEIEVDDANDMDKDGDGQITMDDASSLQAESTSNGEELDSISVTNFMGGPNTWNIQVERFTDDETDSTFTERQFVVNRQVKVQGPNGKQVNAVKGGNLTYYMFDGQGGYYSGSCSGDCVAYTNSSELVLPPEDDYNWDLGLWGWAEYRYANEAKNELIMAGKGDDGTVDWAGADMRLPLNFKPGDEHTQTSDEWEMDTQEYGLLTCSQTETVTVSIVDGAAVAEGSVNLPVAEVKGEFEEVCKDEDGNKVDEYSSDPMQRNFYVVAKYGAQADVIGPEGNERGWAEALAADTRWGTIKSDTDDDGLPEITVTMPADLDGDGNNDADSPFPDDPNPPAQDNDRDFDGTVADLRDHWLTYLWQNLSEIDAFEFSDGSTSDSGNSYFTMADGPDDMLVDPPSWDEANNKPNNLHVGTAQSFTMDALAFRHTGDVNFRLELRVWDDEQEQSVTIKAGSNVGPVTGDTDDAGNPIETDFVAKHGSALEDSLSVTITEFQDQIPEEGWCEWDADMSAEVLTKGVELWLVMEEATDSDDNGTLDVLDAQPVDWYGVMSEDMESCQ